MSGEGINRSIWLILLPLMVLFAILTLVVISQVDFSGWGVPSNFTSGILSGISQILPELGIGIGIGMIILVFAIVRRRR